MVQASHSMVAKIGADITDFSAKLRRAGQETEGFIKRTEDSGKRAESRVNGMLGAATKAQAALAGIAGSAMVAGFGALADQAATLENQMRGIGIATDEARDKIYRLAVETRTPIDATVGLLRSMSKSLRDQPLEQTIRQVATLNRLLTIGGLDAGQRGSVSLQLGQALQSGVLQGDELRALRESAPYELLDAIAKSAGGTVAQLRDLGEQGKLTTATIVRALDEMEQTSKDKFGAFQMTVRESASVLQTALIQAAGRMNEGLGFTDALANAQASLAKMLMDSGDAAQTLGRALNDLTQLALVAAGARGFAALGGALASVNAGSLTLVGTFAALRGAFGGVISLLGGPWGAAFFAAGTALLVLSENSTSVKEGMEEASSAMERAKGAAQEYSDLQGSLRDDRDDLIEKEKELSAAIESQADAAEETARRDIAAIQLRITENERLLDIKQALVAQEQSSARESLEAAEAALASRARASLGSKEVQEKGFLELFAMGHQGVAPALIEANQLPDDRAMEMEVERLRGLIASKEELTDSEWQWLRDYSALTEAKKAQADKDREIEEELLSTYNSHVQAYTAQREKMGAVLNSVVEKEEKRNARLKELYEAREEIERRMLQRGPGGAVDNSLLIQRQNVDAEIEKLTDAQGRLEEMVAVVARVRQVVADIRFVNPEEANRLESYLTATENRMQEIVAAGGDVDNIQLSNLEAELASALTAADRLHQKFIEINTTSINPDFDLMRSKLGGVPADLQKLSYQAIDSTAQRERYTQERIAGTGARTEELVRSVARAAATLGVDPKDLLALILFESGGSPSIRGGAGDRHIGLIQFGPEEQRTYGANQRQTIDEQMDAVIRYMMARGVKAGDDLTTMYAAVLGGHVSKLNASDTSAGGVVRNVTEATRGPQFAPYRARAEGMIGAYEGLTEEEVSRAQEAASEAERAAEARKDWLSSMTDGVEKARLEAEIAGKTTYEQQRILFIEQQKANAKAQNIVWDQEAQQAAERAADAEIEKLRTIGALEKQRELEQIDHQERLLKAQELANEKLAFQARMQESVLQSTVDIVMNSRSWGDALEAAGDLLKNVLAMYVEALMRSAILGQGPMSGQTSGMGGLWGLISGIGSSMLGGSSGGDPLSSALAGAGVPTSLFASSYSPIPNAVALPQLTSAAAPSRAEVDVSITLDEPLLDAKISTGARREVSSAAPRIQASTQRSMTERMRSSKRGWAEGW